MIIPEIIYSTVSNKCPRCHKGKVFKNNNPYSLENGISIEERCSHCNLKYERETGFFYGSMYVSYALMSGMFLLWFLADLIWLHMDPVWLITIVSVTMLGLFPLTYRWARTIWLNFFFRFDKKKYGKHTKVNSTEFKSNTLSAQ